MRTMMRASTLAIFLAALALATGCEDTPLLAGKDFKMTLTAEADPDADEPTWNVIANVVNEANVAQQGITVFFSASTGGVLLHGGQGATTNSSGRAVDVLTLGVDAPSSITVTATSAALSKTVTVTTTGAGLCDINTPPTAVINPPSDRTLPAKTGTETTVSTPNLSAADSTDLQTATLSYLWDCGGGTSTSTVDDHIICVYTYQATDGHFTITLKVTDDGLVGHESECQKSSETSINVTVPGTAP
jgi:hypothetical protein